MNSSIQLSTKPTTSTVTITSPMASDTMEPLLSHNPRIGPRFVEQQRRDEQYQEQLRIDCRINRRMLDGTQQQLLDALTALERGQEDVEVSDPVDAAF